MRALLARHGVHPLRVAAISTFHSHVGATEKAVRTFSHGKAFRLFREQLNCVGMYMDLGLRFVSRTGSVLGALLSCRPATAPVSVSDLEVSFVLRN